VTSDLKTAIPALVLTAGLGTRLRPLTLLRAKPALPVAGVPLVRRILSWLAASGVRRVVLNLHHRPESICAVVGDGSDLGVGVRYSWEDPVLGSGGGPRRALPLLGADRFLIVNGDTLTDVDLDAVVRAHASSGALVTMALVPNPAPERYGGVLVDDVGRVKGFVPRRTAGGSWHFIGVQVAEAAAFAGLSPDMPAESVAGLYPQLMAARPGSVRGFCCHASFRDIGTPSDYLATSLELAAGDPSALSGRGCRISASARVRRSILWEDVIVEDNAFVETSIVADGARVPAGTRVEGALVLPGRLGPLLPAGSARALGDDLLVLPLGGSWTTNR